MWLGVHECEQATAVRTVGTHTMQTDGECTGGESTNTDTSLLLIQHIQMDSGLELLVRPFNNTVVDGLAIDPLDHNRYLLHGHPGRIMHATVHVYMCSNTHATRRSHGMCTVSHTCGVTDGDRSGECNVRRSPRRSTPRSRSVSGEYWIHPLCCLRVKVSWDAYTPHTSGLHRMRCT